MKNRDYIETHFSDFKRILRLKLGRHDGGPDKLTIKCTNKTTLTAVFPGGIVQMRLETATGTLVVSERA